MLPLGDGRQRETNEDTMTTKIRESTGGGYTRRGKHFVRVTDRPGHRTGEHAPWAATLEEAAERGRLVQTWVNRLRQAGQDDFIEKLIEQGALASTPERLAAVEANVEVLTAGRFERLEPAKKKGGSVTFRTFAERWTSGELAKLHPDHIEPKASVQDDIERLTKHVYPHIENVPLTKFTRADADRVMMALPSRLRRATRRQVAQVVHRVIALAVFTGEMSVSPLPPGWMPKPTKASSLAKESLLPSEEAKLLAGRTGEGVDPVPLAYRVAYLFAHREGMRKGEVRRLTWSDLDLKRGMVALDENKTDNPRHWVLDAGVAKVLGQWKAHQGDPKASQPVFTGIAWEQLAAVYRDHCAAVGIDRARLYERKANKLQLRAHDMRAFFVTAGMFAGHDALWITDRSGHTTLGMLRTYERDVRRWRELGESPVDATSAIPEFAAAIAAAARGGNAVSPDRPVDSSARKTSGSGVGIRTPISGSKVRCPAIGRRRKRAQRAEIATRTQPGRGATTRPVRGRTRPAAHRPPRPTRLATGAGAAPTTPSVDGSARRCGPERAAGAPRPRSIPTAWQRRA